MKMFPTSAVPQARGERSHAAPPHGVITSVIRHPSTFSPLIHHLEDDHLIFVFYLSVYSQNRQDASVKWAPAAPQIMESS